MRFKTPVFFSGLLLVLVLTQSCRKDSLPPGPEEQTGTLTVNFVATANNQPFVLGDGYTSVADLKYRFDVFKFYVSNFSLYHATGVDTVLDADLIDYSNTVMHKSFTVNVKAGNYTGFRFGLGLDSTQNNYNPTSFPTTSPFSASQGTHWGMFFMYRFIMIDGAIDTTNDNTANYVLPIVMHTGFDSLYKTKSFADFPFVVNKGGNTTINVNFDFGKLFYYGNDTIDLLTNHITHTSDNYPLAAKVTKNFLNAFQATQ